MTNNCTVSFAQLQRAFRLLQHCRGLGSRPASCEILRVPWSQPRYFFPQQLFLLFLFPPIHFFLYSLPKFFLLFLSIFLSPLAALSYRVNPLLFPSISIWSGNRQPGRLVSVWSPTAVVLGIPRDPHVRLTGKKTKIKSAEGSDKREKVILEGKNGVRRNIKRTCSGNNWKETLAKCNGTIYP